MPLMEAFVLNPPRRRRSKKARRGRGRARRFVKGSRAAKAYMAKLRRMQRRGRRKNPLWRSKAGRYAKAGPHKLKRIPGGGWNPKRRRGGRRRGRRRNPAGLGGLSLDIAQVLPFRPPIPGFAGKLVNGVVQGVAAGGLVFGGYMLSGAVANYILTKESAATSSNAFVRNWARPLMFAAGAGLIGSVTAMIAPKGKRATWALLSAAGPGLRALGGLISAIIPPPSTPGVAADLWNAAAGLADFLQVEGADADGSASSGMADYEEAETGDYEEAEVGQDEDEMEGDEDEVEESSTFA